MPFVEPRHRLPDHKPCSVGDMCFLEYKKLMEAWNKEPRWTTIHNLFKESFHKTDEQAARMLAFIVFFLWEGVPYEMEKEDLNGSID